MNEFTIKKIENTNIQKELENIGFENSYIQTASDKYKYLNLKIYDLTLPQANILKQTALSNGCDCALHKDVLINKIDKTDCILTGSFSQLKKIAKSLKNQDFKLSKLSENLEYHLSKTTQKQTKLVGILNLTTDSFSDGGEYIEFESAIKHLNQMIEDGADIIDIGAESTKPFSNPISAEIQLERILPILNYITRQNLSTKISIDTRHHTVAEECIKNGATIINDVSGLSYDEKMASTIKEYNATVIIQHSKGTPQNMQVNPEYQNLIDEIFLDLKEKTDFAIKTGIQKDKIIIDTGIGFGKKRKDNFEIIKRVEEFNSLGYPQMIGISRKSFLNQETNEEKDLFTVALSTILIGKVDYLRVHNVKLHKELIELMKNIGE